MTGPRSSVVPDLLAALHQLYSARLPEATVTLGSLTALVSGVHLAVGVTDPDASKPTTSATSSVDWHASTIDAGFDEAGEIALAAAVALGSDDLPEAIASVYVVLAEVVAGIRAVWSPSDPLGVGGLWDLHVASTELVTGQDDGGCLAYLLIRVAFQASI